MTTDKHDRFETGDEDYWRVTRVIIGTKQQQNPGNNNRNAAIQEVASTTVQCPYSAALGCTTGS